MQYLKVNLYSIHPYQKRKISVSFHLEKLGKKQTKPEGKQKKLYVLEGKSIPQKREKPINPKAGSFWLDQQNGQTFSQTDQEKKNEDKLPTSEMKRGTSLPTLERLKGL